VSWPGYSADDAQTGQRLVDAGYELLLHPKTGARSPAELAALLGDAVGAIVSTDPFDRTVLAQAARLRVIARVGVGHDSVDSDAATERGIAVAIALGTNAGTVADHALALMLALVRKVTVQDAAMRAGRWDRVGAMTPTELPGKTVGLIGLGRIGRAVAQRLRGFEARILGYDPFVPTVDGVAMLSSLEELLREADLVSLHTPLLPGTRNILNAERLQLLKPTALVINTARGGLLDEAALFEGLRAGSIGGAALDVFDAEPPDASLFEGVPNLVLSPHNAGLSHESIRRMTVMATDNVLRVLAGEMPATVVNREAARPIQRG
jgi:phosphoglycerate dehydrogenase-like enzyme